MDHTTVISNRFNRRRFIGVAAAATGRSTGSTWRYLDNGGNQGTAWQAVSFTDTAWKTCVAPLGYGDPVATVVSFGSSSSQKFVTTYFRRRFTTSSVIGSLSLRLRRDDPTLTGQSRKSW